VRCRRRTFFRVPGQTGLWQHFFPTPYLPGLLQAMLLRVSPLFGPKAAWVAL